jgi:hypothetical protein
VASPLVSGLPPIPEGPEPNAGSRTRIRRRIASRSIGWFSSCRIGLPLPEKLHPIRWGQARIIARMYPERFAPGCGLAGDFVGICESSN